MRTDKSIIRLETYKAKEYKYQKSLGLNCRILCQQNIKKTAIDITKHELFFKMYDLGKSLFEEFNDLTINISMREYLEHSDEDFIIEDSTEVMENDFYVAKDSTEILKKESLII